jgi:hypothetical protein
MTPTRRDLDYVIVPKPGHETNGCHLLCGAKGGCVGMDDDATALGYTSYKVSPDEVDWHCYESGWTTNGGRVVATVAATT